MVGYLSRNIHRLSHLCSHIASPKSYPDRQDDKIQPGATQLLYIKKKLIANDPLLLNTSPFNRNIR